MNVLTLMSKKLREGEWLKSPILLNHKTVSQSISSLKSIYYTLISLYIKHKENIAKWVITAAPDKNRLYFSSERTTYF